MLRTVIQEGAVSAAKANSHATVEPRHVLFALARHFRSNPECEPFFAPAKRALEPPGSHYGAPAVSEEATALLDTLKADADGITALKNAFEGAGDGSSATAGAATQTTEAASTGARTESTAAKPGETVSLVLWAPRGSEGPEVNVLRLDPGGLPVPVADTGRRLNRLFLTSPRFAFTGQELRVRIPSEPVDRPRGFGLELYSWRPAPANSPPPRTPKP